MKTPKYAIINITDAKVKDGMVDISSKGLYNIDGSGTGIHRLTKKGYYSQKPLYLDFITEDRIEIAPNGKPYIELTESEYNFISENYTKSGRVFQTYEQRMRTNKAVGDLAWCSAMKDPYDRG